MFSRKRKIGLRAVICAAALLGLLAAGSPAVASRAFLEPFVTKYEADWGEANQVAITQPTNEHADDYKTTIEIEDPGATRFYRELYTGLPVRRGNLIPSWPAFHHGGCEAIPDSEVYPTRVWCVVEEGQFKVSLRDKNDRFDMGSFPSASVRTAVSGGAGEDVLIGGRATDLLYGDGNDDKHLDGRAGADLLSGGAGKDIASYLDRTVPITVTLPEPPSPPPNTPPPGDSPVEGVTFETFGTADFVATPVAGNDGASGEGDDVQADIEQVDGGFAADTLIGSSTPNELRGFAGDDYLNGNGGNDALHGYAGDDNLRGSGGSDELSGDAGRDDLHGGGGSDVIHAWDRESDDIDCGSGGELVVFGPVAPPGETSYVLADPIDDLRDCD
jgi:hypothetical protein